MQDRAILNDLSSCFGSEARKGVPYFLVMQTPNFDAFADVGTGRNRLPIPGSNRQWHSTGLFPLPLVLIVGHRR